MPNNTQDKSQGSSSNRGFASMDEEKRREAELSDDEEEKSAPSY